MLSLNNYTLEGKRLKIFTYPHPILAKKCPPIETITPELFTLAKNMLYTMYLAPGVGLAAPQIGQNLRMFVLDVNFERQKILSGANHPAGENRGAAEDSDEDEDDEDEIGDVEQAAHQSLEDNGLAILQKYQYSDFDPHVCINPIILSQEGKVTTQEGCLSVPGIYEEIERAENIVVEFTNLEGKRVQATLEGLHAICFQHELDHLNGITFVDRLSLVKRNLYKKKLSKQRTK